MRQRPSVVDTVNGELFCSNCGYVLNEKIAETGPGWRAFSQEEKKDRVHSGPLLRLSVHDMGLSTVIGLENRDASGKALPSSMKDTVERLRTWDGRSKLRAPADRNRRQAFSDLDRLADKLKVSEAVVEKSAYIYRKGTEARADTRQVDFRPRSSCALRSLPRRGNPLGL